MRILVVGGGGREHALCWALRRDFPEATLFAAPGNPGIASLATNLPIGATAVPALAGAVADHRIDLTLVGPEAPLALGLADRLRALGRSVFGPSEAAARLESSKAFAKDVMRAAGVPTAPSATFRSLEPALTYIDAQAEPLVVKASGLAAGKGAVVCSTRGEAGAIAQAMLEGRALGDAGREIVVEAFLEGEELSVLALTDGEEILLLPPAQDHKRLLDQDRGPNTGGMGAYCPVTLATPALLERVRTDVFRPVLRHMGAIGAPYQGVLYAGLMLAGDGTPYVLEFNCRFGDPETEALLPVLPRGAMAHVAEIAAGRWRPPRLDPQAQGAAVATVLAVAGYPDSPTLGAAIAIPPDLGPDVLLFHAGTSETAGVLRVAGGRVMAVTGLAPTVAQAAARSRAACERIAFEGRMFRRDIGWREIARARAP